MLLCITFRCHFFIKKKIRATSITRAFLIARHKPLLTAVFSCFVFFPFLLSARLRFAAISHSK